MNISGDHKKLNLCNKINKNFSTDPKGDIMETHGNISIYRKILKYWFVLIL